MSSKKALPLICELAAALRDGPLTVVGAAELLGCSPITTDKYLRAFEAAKLAHVQGWRRNSRGSPTAVWAFSFDPTEKSEPRPGALSSWRNKHQGAQA